MDINTAIQEVLKQALIADGLARGVRETQKALDKRQALLCILAENCDEPMYKKLISALCMEHGIPLIKVDSNMSWASGPASVRSTGRARLGRWSSAPLVSSGTGARRDPPTTSSRSTSSPSDEATKPPVMFC